MYGKRLTDVARAAYHDVQQSRRQSSLFVDLRDQQTAGDRRIVSRFQNHGIAKRECGPNGAMSQIHWVVPRAYHSDDADRMTIYAAFLARLVDRIDAARYPISGR